MSSFYTPNSHPTNRLCQVVACNKYNLEWHKLNSLQQFTEQVSMVLLSVTGALHDLPVAKLPRACPGMERAFFHSCFSVPLCTHQLTHVLWGCRSLGQQQQHLPYLLSWGALCWGTSKSLYLWHSWGLWEPWLVLFMHSLNQLCVFTAFFVPFFPQRKRIYPVSPHAVALRFYILFTSFLCPLLPHEAFRSTSLPPWLLLFLLCLYRGSYLPSSDIQMEVPCWQANHCSQHSLNDSPGLRDWI